MTERCTSRGSRIPGLNASNRVRSRRRAGLARQAAIAAAAAAAAAASRGTGTIETGSCTPSTSTSGTNTTDDESNDEDPLIKSTRSDKENDAMQTRLDWKLGLLYTLLVLQVLVVMIYVASTPHVTDVNPPPSRDAVVTFLDVEIPRAVARDAYYENRTRESKLITGETSLREVKTSRLFESYNRTLCWRFGVNDRRTRREERCACEPGWHGSDCGQPEVVWRAIMASKQNVRLERRKLARRIIHTFYVNDYNSAIAEVIIEELYDVVDLFVVCDFSVAEDNFRHKLGKGFLGKQQDKILYVNVVAKAKKPARVISKYVWEKVKRAVRNIRDDDIYVTTDAEQILNGRALMFLKTYDGWPQPIGFRLRWSVFGFFWQHPLRTTITIGACTVGLMREAYRFNSLVLEKEIAEREALGLVIGDLNHYGGWYCQFCQGPANIILALREKNRTREYAIEKNVDVPFIEDLIGSGTWFDEKTSLVRAHKSTESYYAPETVMNQTWKYDWLLENFYAKLDYY